MTVKPRLNPYQAAPDAMQALGALENHVRNSGLEPSLIELVKTRASQINGCAFCIHMHTRDARVRGETEERLYLLDAWRESPLYTERERAALAWTEAVTLVAQTHVPDAVTLLSETHVPRDVYDEAAAQFTEPELAQLISLILTINAWNRIAIGFRSVHPTKDARAAA